MVGSRRRWVVAAAGAWALVGALVAPQSGVAAPAQLREFGAPFATAGFGDWLMDFATGDSWSSPAVGDVTGDGVPEIVVGGLNSIVRVYRLDGSLLAALDPGGASFTDKTGATHASPALGDINGDGVADIVIANTGSIMAAYSLRGGVAEELMRKFEPRAFEAGPNGLFATPALGYVDGDSRLDIVTASWGQLLDVWSGRTANRVANWPQWLKDTIWSSPAIGDVDGDGANEIVVGGDCDGSGQLQPCFGAGGGGYIWVFNLDGTLQWSYFVAGQTIWSSPALADLNGDGALDIVTGTGAYWPEPAGRKVIALDGRTGRLIWEAPTAARVVGSPSVADVDGDGRPEIFIIARGGRMLSYEGENGQLRWQSCIDDRATCSDANSATHGGVALADVDGDGVIEAVTQGEQQLRVYDARTGALETSVRSSYPRTLFAPSSTPTIASVNGATWIVQTAHGDANGNLQRDAGDELVVMVWVSNSALGAAPWPTFKGNMARTSGPLPVPIDPAPTRRFVEQLYRDFLARPAGAAEVDSWTTSILDRRSTRYAVATELSRSNEWITTLISGFYRDTLRREPDAAGLSGWIAAARSGMPVAQIASAFYSSPEYFSTVGRSDHRTWVADLYRKLLLREPDGAGLDGWVRALGAGMPRDTLAFGFYQSGETLGVRVTKLYGTLLGRTPEAGAIGNWSPFVSNQGDLVLAAALAASDEYFSYAQTAR